MASSVSFAALRFAHGAAKRVHEILLRRRESTRDQVISDLEARQAGRVDVELDKARRVTTRHPGRGPSCSAEVLLRLRTQLGVAIILTDVSSSS